MQACGEPHRPSFTVLCQLSSIKRTGTFYTKRGAKQIAARAVLNIIQGFPQNEELQKIAIVTTEKSEKTFPTYRDLKHDNIEPVQIKLRDRHRFFRQLPKEDCDVACNILVDKSGNFVTNKDKVDSICATLKLNFEVKDIPNHKEHYQVFLLESDYGCAIADEQAVLYDRVVDHFKIMLNCK